MMDDGNAIYSTQHITQIHIHSILYNIDYHRTNNNTYLLTNLLLTYDSCLRDTVDLIDSFSASPVLFFA